MSAEMGIFQQLMAVIGDRKRNPPNRSYTTSLLEAGVAKIGEKILEEAAEVVDAAHQSDDDAHLIHEAADLIFHLFVMLGYRDIPITAVEQELQRRFGTSGLDEKESRGQK